MYMIGKEMQIYRYFVVESLARAFIGSMRLINQALRFSVSRRLSGQTVQDYS